MKRFVIKELQNWLNYSGRKPLILRGARQVGKTWAVRELARIAKRQLVELNFERDDTLATLFNRTDPREIVRMIAAKMGKVIDPKSSLLFLDEVQAAPQTIPALRWFYEELPELPVIAAGSLLEFTLADHDFSMPVGRVSYCWMEPLSFLEFIEARGYSVLAERLREARQTLSLDPVLHETAVGLLREYCLTGGMPAVVAAWIERRDDYERARLQADILASFQDDFNKYRNRVALDSLREVFSGVPRQLGCRFKYSRVNAEEKSATIKRAFNLLVLARVCDKVAHSDAIGIPLGADADDSVFKALFLDVGLAQSLLGLSALDFERLDDAVWSNQGAIAEQVVGQLLRARTGRRGESLYYWQRAGNSNAEIDYVVQLGFKLLPVEVKSGTAGSMKSLHQLVAARRFTEAVRFDLNPPSEMMVNCRTTQGEPVNYRLVSLPIYLAELL